MRYPTLANWIRFKRVSEEDYLIIDLLHDKQIEADEYTVWFVRQLNGKTNPYTIDRTKSKQKIDIMLDELKEEEVIRDKRFLSKFFLYLLVTIWRPRITSGLCLASFFINGLLLVSWLPLLIFSVYYILDSPNYDFSVDYIVPGCFAGMFIGILLHELGHMFACLAYGGRVFEVGAFLQFLVLPGAYVLLNQSTIKKRMRRVQVNAAGVEMNLLLTAIFLILSAKIEVLGGFFLGAAIQNALLALLNLTFVNGFDGMAIISELLGIENLVDQAKRITKSKSRKKRLIKAGVTGQATLVICYVFRAIQIALPLIFAINIAGVFSWFE